MQETLETNQKIASRKQFFTLNRRAIRVLILLVALVVGALSIAPYFFSHYTETSSGRAYRLIYTHDLTNHYFMMGQFESAARSGALYPRWLAEGNKGYGIATMNFYPPGFFYLTTIVNGVFNDWHSTLLFLMILAFAGSGITLYFLARTFYGRVPSAIAALVYILLPYHQVDLYWRGALPELMGFVFMPLTLYFAYKAGTAGRWRDYAGLGFFYGIHLLTHLPVAVMFSYALAFYALVWAARERDLKIAIRIAAGMALGLLVSAIYWFPAALEAKYAYEYASVVFPYHGSYVSTLPADTPFDRIIQNSLKFSVLFLFTAVAVIRLLPQRARPIEMSNTQAATETQALSQVRIWIIMCGAALFMTTAYSYDISKLLPKIEVTVPPFRWMAISAVFTSLLVAACVDCLRRVEGLARWRLWAYRGVVGAVIALSLWLTFSKVIYGALENPTFVPAATYIEQGLIPKDATAPEKLPDTPPVVIEPQNGSSEIVRWYPQSREVRVNVDQPSRVRLKTYNFPGWTARVDGQKVPVLSDKDGIQIINVAPGSHTIEVTFENTLPRILGAAFTAIGFLAVFGLAIADNLKRGRRRADLPLAESSTGTQKPDEESRPDKVSGPDKLRLSRQKIIILATVAAVIAAVALVMFIRQSNRNFKLRTKEATAVGSSEGRLFVEGLDLIPVAADDATFNELIGALVSREGARMDALTNSGKVIKVAGNTRIKILERASGKTKVLIMEGEHQAEEGWVMDRWVR
ncbi:MAG: 6-pyruvoyl-tetrahydropterin synthase-related protein [Blastocatellia bacterium]